MISCQGEKLSRDLVKLKFKMPPTHQETVSNRQYAKIVRKEITYCDFGPLFLLSM